MQHRVLQRPLRKGPLRMRRRRRRRTGAASSNGSAAPTPTRQHQHDIHVIITDLMMPAMDGHALIRTLHQINPDVRIIAASGLSTHENLVDTTGRAVRAFLPKPYETTRLLATLDRVVHEPDTVSVSPSL